MTIFKHLALAALCKADTFYTDPSKIDREAISEFRNLFERNFCSGNQSAPCPDGGNKVCANDGWTYSSACDFKRNYCLGRRSLRFHHWGACGKINDFANDFVMTPTVENDDCVKSCTKELRWVCGTDGESYTNICNLEIATCKSGGEVEFASHGKCAIQGRDERPSNDEPDYEDEPEINVCDMQCPSREYSPLCGSDGVTYSSLCKFECAVNESGITLKHRGACRGMANDFTANRFTGRFPVSEPQDEEEESCKKCLTKEIRYVCGTNGRTYNTECELNYDRCQFGVDVAREHYGPCAGDKSSLMLGDFVNDFLEEVAKEEEEEQEVETCENLRCTFEKDPVCGEFRDVLIPYINTCYMKMFSCKLAGNLYSIRARGKPKRNACKSNGRNKRSEEDDGFCLTKMGCPRMLGGMSNRGVCGSDGVTYMNECELKRANCESDEEISLVYNDFCESECALNPMEINMQCGTNGLTYWNMCALKEFNYLNRATDPYAESISVAYPGPCSVTNVQMLNDFPTENTYEEEAEEVIEEYEYEEEEESEDMNPYSEANCRRRKEENFSKPCNSFDHKSCYSDGKKYSLCQFRLAKCDDPGLVLAIDPQSCETLRGW